jgi:hypothetical protein
MPPKTENEEIDADCHASVAQQKSANLINGSLASAKTSGGACSSKKFDLIGPSASLLPENRDVCLSDRVCACMQISVSFTHRIGYHICVATHTKIGPLKVQNACVCTKESNCDNLNELINALL